MICHAFLLAGLLAVSGIAGHAGPIGVDDVMRLPPARILILGEVHDNAEHHRNQARIVAQIRPAAIVFEMLSPAQAKAAAGTDRTDAAAMAEALGWAGSGWPDYALYHPVFAASGQARLYGAALDRAQVRRAMTEDAAAVFGDDAARFGLTMALPAAEQAAREAEQLAAHCNALPAALLPGMVAAQRLRDAAFARSALVALAETGGPVVVITGSGHADTQRGIPAALRRAAPGTSVLSIGQTEQDPGPLAPFDHWIVTAPTPRDDPCASFAKP